MKHREKLRIARKLSPKGFLSPEWEARKKGIEQRVQNKIAKTQKRIESKHEK